MGLSTNKDLWKIMLGIFLVVTLIFIVLFYFRTLFITFILGGGIILLAERLITDYKKRMKKYGLRGYNAKILGYFLFFFWTFIVLFAIGGSISDFGDIFEKVVEKQRDGTFTIFYQEQIGPFLPEFFRDRLIDDEFIRGMEDSFVSYLIYYSTYIISNISALLFNSILIIPLMVYMYFRKREKIKKDVCNLIPGEFRESFSTVLRDVGKQLHSFFAAKAIESVAVASICCFGFYVAGLNGWLFLGILVGILNIIPYLGPIIGALPPLLIAFIDQPLVAFYVLITIIIAQLVDNFYLIPFMITRKVSVQPLLGIVIILAGAQLFGIMGMIFGIPVYLVYKIVLREAYKNLEQIYG